MVDVLGPADKAYGGHAETSSIETFLYGFNNLFIIRQAEIVVGAHIYHLLFTDPDAGLLGGS